MSRSQPTLINPAQYFMSWSGSTGVLAWYNKEKQINVPVKLPFRFLVLDQLATIKGYNKLAKTGFWSNEVRNTRKDELTVRSKQGVIFTGFYKNEHDIVQVPKGAEYTQSVYIAHKVDNQWVIGNLNMKGSARSAWFDFTNTCKPENGTVIMSKGDVQTALTGDFYPPALSYESSTDEEFSVGINLDKELQIYLSQYLAANKEEHEQEQLVPEAKQLVDMSDPANLKERPSRSKLDDDKDAEAVSLYHTQVYAEIEGEEVSLEDIPF